MRKLAALGLLSMTGCQAFDTLKSAPSNVIDSGVNILTFIGNTLLQLLLTMFRGFFAI